MGAPLSDAVITAMAQLVDDAQSRGGRRDPSHDEITFLIKQGGLSRVEQATQNKPMGKAKRVRWVLSQCLSQDVRRGEAFVEGLLGKLRAHGGFRPGSQNFVGDEAIQNARAVFRAEGYELLETGELVPAVLDALCGRELTEALRAYARRARQGSTDAALLLGTGKDLLEATAKHVLVEKGWQFDRRGSFSHHLGQAFTALGMATVPLGIAKSEPPQAALERSLYDAGCAVNRLRGTEGTGHGRPFPATVTASEARAAVELTGVVAEYLLSHLDS